MSTINGLVGVDGPASLFFVNPSGVVLGAQSDLDIAGAFILSTASGFEFEDGEVFSAITPEDSVLTVAVPLGLQFAPTAMPNTSIVSQGDIDVEQDLTFLSDEIILEGTLQNSGNLMLLGKVISPDGQVIRSGGQVTLDSYEGGSLHILAGDDVTIGGDVVITSASSVGNSINPGDSELATITGGNNQRVLLGRTPIYENDQLLVNDGEIQYSGGERVVVASNVVPTLDIRAGTTAHGQQSVSRSDEAASNITIEGSINSPGGTVILTNQFQSEQSDIDGHIQFKDIDIRTVNGSRGTAVVDSRGTITLNGEIDSSGESFFTFPFGIGIVGDGGEVFFKAEENINLLQGSAIITSGERGGAISLLSNSGEVNIQDSVLAQLSTGDAGGSAVVLEGRRIEIVDGSIVGTLTSGSGTSGVIAVAADEQISVLNRVPSSGEAGAGTFIIGAVRSVFPGTGIATSTISSGAGGAIDIVTPGAILVQNQIEPIEGSSGQPSLGGIATVSLGGESGTLRVTADSIVIEGSEEGPFFPDFDDTTAILLRDIPTGFSSAAQGFGDAGALTVNARSLSLRDGAGITSGSVNGSFGDGALMTFNITDTIDLDGKAILGNSSIGDITSGNSGDLVINGGESVTIQLSQGAVISTSTNSQGEAGSIDITGANLEILSGGRIVASTVSSPQPSGNITINISDVILIDGQLAQPEGAETLSSGVFASSETGATGEAGNISISAELIRMLAGGQISTAAEQSAGGNIFIEAGDVQLLEDADITTNVVAGESGGGDIVFEGNTVVALDDSDVLAFSTGGPGGNVVFNSLFFGENYQPTPPGTNPSTLDGNNQVDVNASGTVDGIIVIQDVSFIEDSLNRLAAELVPPRDATFGSCIARSSEETGVSFTVTGADGLASRPGDSVSRFPAVEVQPIDRSGRDVFGESENSFIEPTDIYRFSDGRIVMSRDC